MAEHIPREFIDTVLSRTDIIDLIDSFVPLKKLGANYKACCPFHEEKSPSFVASPAKQIYHCFGCGVGGNAISFIMEYENANFVEAIKLLAKRLNLTVPTTGSSSPKDTQKTDDLYDTMAKAVQYYQVQLKNSATAAKEYLVARGLTGDIAKQYSLGFAPDGWDNLINALQQSCSPTSLIQAGLVIQKEANKRYDRFRERIIYPIRNRQGKYIALGGRIIDQGEPKYLNSPETPIYSKSRELYGLFELLKRTRQPEYIVVVEGYMDVLALVQHGIENAVGTLGTATTEQHINLLFRHTDQVVFCFDGDKAGKTAAWRALTTLLPHVQDSKSVKFMFLPDGEDPDSFIRAHGQEYFQNAIAKADSLPEFFLKTLSQGIQFNEVEGRAKFASQTTQYLNKMPEGHFKQIMSFEIAAKTKLPVEQILPKTTTARRSPAPQYGHKTPSVIRHGITLVLQHPRLAIELHRPIPNIEFPGFKLLIALLEMITEYPHVNTAGILERWRDTQEHPHLLKLANEPLFIPEEGLLEEFKDTIDKICTLAAKDRIDHLLGKSAKNALSHEEKQELQQLLLEKA